MSRAWCLENRERKAMPFVSSVVAAIPHIPLAVPGPITWVPSAAVNDIARIVAGLVVALWLVAVVFTFLFPGKGSRNLFSKMGFGKIVLAVLSILVLANLQIVPDIGNWFWTYVLVPVWNSIPNVPTIK